MFYCFRMLPVGNETPCPFECYSCFQYFQTTLKLFKTILDFLVLLIKGIFNYKESCVDIGIVFLSYFLQNYSSVEIGCSEFHSCA